MLRRRVSIVYIAGVCLLSVIVQAAILPQYEMRELDIFLQDEGYSQISRTKRTDNNDNSTAVEPNEGSGEDEANITDSLPKNEPATLLARSSQLNIDPPPTEVSSEQPSTNFSYLVQPRNLTEVNTTTPIAHLEVSSEAPEATEITTSDSLILNVTEATAATTEANAATTTIEAEILQTASPLPTENLQENNTQLTTPSLPPPNVFEGIQPKSPDININLNSTNDNTASTQNATDTIDSPNLDNTPTIQNGTDSLGETPKPPDYSPPAVQNATNTVTNDTKPVASDTVTGVIQATTAKPIKTSAAVTTAKPAAAEIDKTKKSSVSGSGILFTIIILVAVASLAGLGYYIYKRRQRRYDPVQIEDQDKEMTEIKSENGFGKPILAEEVKLQDQLTPYEPQPAPRTFGIASLHEEAFGNVEVIREDSDKDPTVQSVEFEEEGTKKDEKH